MVFLTKRRDTIEVINDILDGVSKGFSTTRIMMYSNTNHAYIKKILGILLERDLIRIDRESVETRSRYYLTERGTHLRSLLSSFQLLLVYGNVDHVKRNPGYDKKDMEEKSRIIARELSTKKKRSHVEIYFTILSSIIVKPRTLSSIANQCYLNLEQATRYLEELLELKMIVEVNDTGKKKYQITDKGVLFLEIYLKIYELVHGSNHDLSR